MTDEKRNIQGYEAAEPLDKDRFWQLIGAAREAAGDWKGMLQPLVESLTRLDAPDIIRFNQIYDAYIDLAYKEKLWAAAAVMHNGCSDDGFIDFRAWLIAQGKEVYINALADPDSLAGVESVRAFAREVIGSEYLTPMAGYSEAAEFEVMSYAAGDAYAQKLGSDADIYTILDNNFLPEWEKSLIADEITYAADIDEKWTGHDIPWLDTLAELEKRCPKLYSLFHDAETPEHAYAAPQKPAEKESVLEKIIQNRRNKQQTGQQNQKPKKQTKGGPEL